MQVGLASLAALALMVAALPALCRSVSLDYSEQLGRMMSSSNRRSRRASTGAAASWLKRGFDYWFLRDAEERAFFYFILAMVRGTGS